MENNFDVIIIGAGPAGLTAGIYLSRAKVKVLILNEGIAGGQMVLTHEVANYPGIENISGSMGADILIGNDQCNMISGMDGKGVRLACKLAIGSFGIRIGEKERK